MTDPRLGTPTSIPQVTLSGAAYMLPASIRGIGNGYYVVLDTFPPKGFDVEAAMQEVAASIPQPVAKPVASKIKKGADDESDS